MSRRPPPDVELLDLIASSSKSELATRLMRHLQELCSLDYVQIWLEDPEEKLSPLYLVLEEGNRSASVATEHFRLLPQNGLAGRAATRKGVIWVETSNPADLAILASPDFVLSEDLRTIVAVPLSTPIRGVILAASRGKSIEGSEHVARLLEVVGGLTLARLSALQAEAALEAASFVASSLSLSSDEEVVFSTALDRMSQVFDFRQAIVFKSSPATETLRTVGSWPQQTNRPHRALSQSIARVILSETPCRFYSIGADVSTDSAVPLSDLLDLIQDIVPDDEVEGSHLLILPLQSRTTDIETLSGHARNYGTIVFLRFPGDQGFTHLDSRFASVASHVFAAILVEQTRARRVELLLDTAVNVAAEPLLEDIRLRVLRSIEELLPDSEARSVSASHAADQAMTVSSNGTRRSGAPLNLIENLSPGVIRTVSSDHGVTHVVPVSRLGTDLGALLIAAKDRVDKSDEPLLLLMADHLALAESESRAFGENALTRLAVPIVTDLGRRIVDLYRCLVPRLSDLGAIRVDDSHMSSDLDNYEAILATLGSFLQRTSRLVEVVTAQSPSTTFGLEGSTVGDLVDDLVSCLQSPMPIHVEFSPPWCVRRTIASSRRISFSRSVLVMALLAKSDLSGQTPTLTVVTDQRRSGLVDRFSIEISWHEFDLNHPWDDLTLRRIELQRYAVGLAGELQTEVRANGVRVLRLSSDRDD